MRRAGAARYQELFKTCGCDVLLPYEPAWTKPVYHLFVVRTQHREQMMKHLASAGIGTGIHYPIPLHLQKAYASLGYRRGDFPVTERVAEEIVSLPMFPGLQAEQQKRVAGEVMAFVANQQVSADLTTVSST
jgi:dTDP-4-amino-4,6-dideoxygalactose transaminase